MIRRSIIVDGLGGFEMIRRIATGFNIIWKSGHATISRKSCKDIEIPNSLIRQRYLGHQRNLSVSFEGTFKLRSWRNTYSGEE
jgi:hypothetical protein